MQAIFTVVTAFLSFVGGWLVATEKNRSELFKAKLASYSEMNRLMSRLFLLHLKAEIDQEAYEPQILPAYEEASERFVSMALIANSDVGDSITKFLATTRGPAEDQRKELNRAIKAMAKDLRLDHLDFINQATHDLIGILRIRGKDI